MTLENEGKQIKSNGWNSLKADQSSFDSSTRNGMKWAHRIRTPSRE